MSLSTTMKMSSFLLIEGLLGVHAVADLRTDAVLMQGNRAGQQTVAVHDARAEYFYNDRIMAITSQRRGRSTQPGMPVAFESCGHDYSKAPVEERFVLARGKASWRNRHESGEQALRATAFYMPANPVPESYGVLARALIKAPNGRVALLPSGSVSIEPAGSLSQMFKFGIHRDLVEDSPVKMLFKSGGKEEIQATNLGWRGA